MIAPGTCHHINPDGLYRRICDIGYCPPTDGDYVRLAGMYGIGVGDMRHLIKQLELIQRMEVEFMGKLDKDKAMDLYRKGYSDIKIGELLGTSSANVNFWRRSNKLPANCTGGGRPVKQSTPKDSAVTDMVPEKKADPVPEDKPMVLPILQPIVNALTGHSREQVQSSANDLQDIINRLTYQVLFLRGIAIGAGVKDIDQMLADIET